jgi:hypothetical protein
MQLNAGDPGNPTITNFRELLERVERERATPMTTALR